MALYLLRILMPIKNVFDKILRRALEKMPMAYEANFQNLLIHAEH